MGDHLSILLWPQVGGVGGDLVLEIDRPILWICCY